MSAVLTRRRPSRARDRDREAARSVARQESLFGASGSLAPAPPREPRVDDAPPHDANVLDRPPSDADVLDAPPLEPTAGESPAQFAPARGNEQREPAAPARAPVAGRTLDEAITALWGDLVTGATVACPACGSTALQPRHSAGAGVVGGRCGACDATLA